MDTIRNYVDAMFKDLPKTKEVIVMKLNILDHMEDKYNELLKEGKSDNEAIGTVISQFGNIDEVKDALGISSTSDEEKEKEPDVISYADDDMVIQYLSFKKHFAYMMAIGVSLCILSVIPVNFSFLGDGGVILLFFIVACAVIIFILSCMKNADYSDFEKNPIKVHPSLEHSLSIEYRQFKSKFAIYIAIGVALCILAPVFYMVIDNLSISYINGFPARYLNDTLEGFATSSLFISVAIGVFLFTSSGIKKSAYDILLQNDKKRAELHKEEEDDRLYGMIMPLAGILYLLLGFGFGWWHPGWLIFPIAALLTSALNATRGGCDN